MFKGGQIWLTQSDWSQINRAVEPVSRCAEQRFIFVPYFTNRLIFFPLFIPLRRCLLTSPYFRVFPALRITLMWFSPSSLMSSSGTPILHLLLPPYSSIFFSSFTLFITSLHFLPPVPLSLHSTLLRSIPSCACGACEGHFSVRDGGRGWCSYMQLLRWITAGGWMDDKSRNMKSEKTEVGVGRGGGRISCNLCLHPDEDAFLLHVKP